MLGRVRALVADAVDGLDLEAVEGVGPQVADEHPGLLQTQLSGNKVHIVVAVRAGTPVGAALLADNVVDDVLAAAHLPGGVPLEDHRGFIHDGDHVPGAGWNACGHEGKRPQSSTCIDSHPATITRRERGL